MPIEQVYANMNLFEESMDSIIVQGKVMDQAMNKHVDAG